MTAAHTAESRSLMLRFVEDILESEGTTDMDVLMAALNIAVAGAVAEVTNSGREAVLPEGIQAQITVLITTVLVNHWDELSHTALATAATRFRETGGSKRGR